MLKNYLKIAFRNIVRDRVYSFINVAGLSVGLAATFIILLYSFNQLSYDRYNKKLDRIYLVTTHLSAFHWTEATTPYPLGPAIKDQFPEVEESARWGASSGCSIGYNGRQFGHVRCVSADPSIFRILTFPILSGSLTEIFDGKSSAVISKSMAERIFGAADPVGKIITIWWEGTSYSLIVSAVMKDMPAASTIRADAIVPLFVSGNSINKDWSHVDKAPLESWNLQPIQTYVLLSSAQAASLLDKKLVDFSRSHSEPGNPSSFQIYPLKDVYFGAGDLVNSIFPTGNKKVVDIYLAIALLTLLIACVDFVILGTSRTGIRMKEMGVRKVVGASRWDLAGQVMTESVLTSLLSLPVSFLFVEIFLPYITSLLGESLPSSYLDSYSIIALFAAIAIIVGIVSGSYVSFYLSSLHPVDILRSKTAMGRSKGALIRVLVVVEMVIFIGLISASITVYRQLSYFNHRNLGFDKKNLLVFYSNPKDLRDRFSAFRSELESDPQIAGVCGAQFLPAAESRAVGLFKDKLDPSRSGTFEFMSVDRGFIETMRIKMAQGKSFSEVTPEESKDAVILNQTAVRAFNIKNPLSQQFNGGRIIGIVEDFNLHSLREKVPPVVISCNTDYINAIAVRVRTSKDIRHVISFVGAESKSFNGGKPMEDQSFGDRLKDMYGSDYKFADMVGYFTGIAILVACLGLFGLSLSAAERRVKEIGIRKVVGASSGNIVGLLTKEFVALSLISTATSMPVMVYIMEDWLRNYAYHVNFNVSSAVLTFVSALVIVFLTVGYRAIKASTANPVESLRYE